MSRPRRRVGDPALLHQRHELRAGQRRRDRHPRPVTVLERFAERREEHDVLGLGDLLYCRRRLDGLLASHSARTPLGLRLVGPRLDEAVETSARELVDELAGDSGEGECDFVNAVAVRHPLRLLSTILGVEREDEPRILRVTNELFGADDPDLQREGEDRDAAMKALGLELFQYFSKIIEDRRWRGFCLSGRRCHG